MLSTDIINEEIEYADSEYDIFINIICIHLHNPTPLG